VHRKCHRCETDFASEKVCNKCHHTRCKKCPRHPYVLPFDFARNPAYALAGIKTKNLLDTMRSMIQMTVRLTSPFITLLVEHISVLVVVSIGHAANVQLPLSKKQSNVLAVGHSKRTLVSGIRK
jgi:hypothetical protein